MRFLFSLLAFTLIALPLGCKEESGSGGKNVLIVGTEATFPPFEMRDADDNFIGLDMDLVRAIGKKIGRDVQFKDMKFDTLIQAVQQGEIDMIASGFSITEERKSTVDFSDAYLEAPIALAVRTDESAIKSSADLRGRVAAVQSGSTGANAAEKLKEEGKLGNIRYFDNVPIAMMELTTGGVDVVISDRPTSEAYIAIQGNQKIKLLEENLQSDHYGFAFRKGNDDLRNQVNKALAELKAEGEIDRLKDKYFKQYAAEQSKAAPTAAPAAN